MERIQFDHDNMFELEENEVIPSSIQNYFVLILLEVVKKFQRCLPDKS